MQEQQSVTAAGEDIKLALHRANREYEGRFNHTFIVCATPLREIPSVTAVPAR